MQQRVDQLRHGELLQQRIAEALAALEQIEGWAEHRGAIRGHLERAQKKARELEMRMWASRQALHTEDATGTKWRRRRRGRSHLRPAARA
jgi:hypothetical protein